MLIQSLRACCPLCGGEMVESDSPDGGWFDDCEYACLDCGELSDATMATDCSVTFSHTIDATDPSYVDLE
jgi:hypothetical protein